jgi:hypothetical protein
MAKQDSIQDNNQVWALIAHTGTAGTAETQRVVADTDGNLMVNIAAGESINIGTLTLGTIDMLKAGTITTILGTTKVEDANYDILVEDANATTTYYGYAALGQGTNTSGAVWRILRKIYDSTSSQYYYAGGTDAFSFPWSGRGTLSYS